MSGRTFLVLSLITAAILFIVTISGAIFAASALRARRASASDLESWRQQALVQMEKGDLESAKVLTEKVLRERPTDAVMRANLGRLHRRIGQEKKDQSHLYRAIAEHKLAIASGAELPDLYYNVACYYAVAGATDPAFEWLVRALDRGFGRTELLKTDPDLESLRRDPRFKALLQSGHIPRSEPHVESHLSRERVGVGDTVVLEIRVERFVAAQAVAEAPVPEVEWTPPEGVELVHRTEKDEVDVDSGWARLTKIVRVELKARRDGLLAIPAAKVKLGDRDYDSGALVLNVEAPAAELH